MRKKEDFIHSVNLNMNTEFPYLVLNVINDNSYPLNLGFHVMHWHEDLQFIYVLDGKVEVITLDGTTSLQEGEAVFINKNVVHEVRRVGVCHYNSFLFPSYFLEFYGGSLTKAVVTAITENEQLSLIPIKPQGDWQRQILGLLWHLVQIEENKKKNEDKGNRDEYYAYEVLCCLSSLWIVLRKYGNDSSASVQTVNRRVNERMQQMLCCIEQRYFEDLTLEDLAKSANISKAECARCFQESLHTTPYRYLIEFRLARAAERLQKTEEPIGVIAANVGFLQVSHFGKCFKEKTGFTPKEYRKHYALS